MSLFKKMGNSEDNIKRIINLMQSDDSVDAPEDALKWSKNIFRTGKATEPKRSVIEKVLAVLQMDLSPDKPAFGERSTTVGKTRQMLFEAGENNIDLRISADEKSFTIKGQVLGAGFENAEIKFGSYETVANEMSEFIFSEIPADGYDLIITTDEKEILIENIELP